MSGVAAHSHVAVVTNDIATAGAFYINVFGFRPAGGTFGGAGPELARVTATASS